MASTIREFTNWANYNPLLTLFFLIFNYKRLETLPFAEIYSLRYTNNY